jgi:hypothetical protein
VLAVVTLLRGLEQVSLRFVDAGVKAPALDFDELAVAHAQ